MDLSLDELMNINVSIGTRGENRTAFNSPAPINVITSQEIMQSGLNELTSVIQRYIPAFNAPRPSISDGSDHIQAFSLKGLGADQMLVLINGVRKHNSALIHVNSTVLRGTTSNDLNVIPIASVERIEILSDGAAAQYGTDAISGIINIVLKSSPDRSVSYHCHQTTEGDGETYQVSASAGYYVNSEEFLTITTELRDRDYTNRSIPRHDLTGRDSIPALLGQKFYRYGDAALRDVGLVYNFSHIFIPIIKTRVYAFGFFNHRSGESAGYYRLPSQTRVPLYGFSEGFLPLLTPTIQDKSLTVGFESNSLGLRRNLSFTYGKNSMQFNLENSLNSSIGPSSPRSFYCGSLHFQHYILNLNLHRFYDLGVLHPLSVGGGIELRYETFIQEAGEEASYLAGNYSDTATILGEFIERESYPAGSQMIPGFQPSNARNKSRNSVSAYLDLENQLTPKLLLGLAGRWEDYSDFGSTVNGKLSVRYEFVPGMVFRSSASTGFRSPSLGQSYFTAMQTNLAGRDLIQSGTYSVDDPIAIALGAKPLKAEQSIHLNTGLVVQPYKSLSLSLDYFYIHIDDRIVLTGHFSSSTPSNYVRSVLTRYGIEGAKFFTNAIDTKTHGLDLVLKYDLQLRRIGNIIFSAAVNLNQTRLDGDIHAVDTMKIVKEVFFDRQQIVKTEQGQPRRIAHWGMDYSFSQWAAQLKIIHYGDTKYVQDASDPSLDQVFKGKTLCDLAISYKLNRSVRCQIGGHNIFNSYPDEYLEGRGDYYLRYCDSVSPFGFNGADYYAQIHYKF
ncbi:MAG: TonB-dependent receptor [Candidatus Delongbacteria bacterium]|nr:TonB-dependent receptor [Candidatus Delongbacteria bacterium]